VGWYGKVGSVVGRMRARARGKVVVGGRRCVSGTGSAGKYAAHATFSAMYGFQPHHPTRAPLDRHKWLPAAGKAANARQPQLSRARANEYSRLMKGACACVVRNLHEDHNATRLMYRRKFRLRYWLKVDNNQCPYGRR